MDWFAGPTADVCRQRWTKHAHGHARAGCVVSRLRSLAIGWNKSSHSEVVRLMRVQHFRCANLPPALLIDFANQSANTRQSDCQAFGFWSSRSKQSTLRV